MWIKKLFNGKFNIVFGLVLGVVLMGGFSYAVDSLNSESVSYTKQDGKLTTVKTALDELISKSLVQIDELKEKVTDYETGIHYLADVVKIGEYVAYDAGTWNETKNKPNTQGQFGGYTIGKSKNDSVACFENTAPTLQGWRVLKVDKPTKTVTIIHAGQPECYYHALGSEPATSDVNALNNQATQQYLDTAYSDSAHAMNLDDRNEKILNTGAWYWFANEGTVGYLYGLKSDGTPPNSGFANLVAGFRPVIVLKSKILTTGKGTDEFGQPAWTLVAKK